MVAEATKAKTTDVQLMALALAVIIPLSMLIYSNSRITDTKETLRAEMQTLRTEMQKGFGEIFATLDRIAAQIKNLETTIEMKLDL
jgi:hypothetical protein